MNNKPIKVVLIGPFPPPTTGTTVLLEQLRSELSARDDVAVTAINSLGIRGHKLRGLWKIVCLFFKIIKAASHSDVVSLHGSTSGLHVIGPLVTIACKIARRPLIIRKFGGGDFSNFGRFRRKFIWWSIQKADLYLSETLYLVKAAKDAGINHVRWYPNSRPIPPNTEKDRSESESRRQSDGCKKFVFAGHVREYKGIRDLIIAAERLREGIIVDVYGPLFDDLEEDIFDKCKRVAYKGELEPKDVVPTLLQYDAALLPTRAQSEGYPGAVIESYNAGIPIITTTCGAIPEIVDDSCGILVEPSRPDLLYDAMKRLVEDQDFYCHLLEGARRKAGMFSSENWTKCFLDYCRELTEKP